MTEPESVNVGSLSDEEGARVLALLAERFGVYLQDRKPLVDWDKSVADGHALENEDGTIVLRLHHPVDFMGSKVSRVTMGRIRVKDMRAAAVDDRTDLGKLTESLVEPRVFALLERMGDHDLFVAAGNRQLGKFLGTSRTPTSTAASDASSAQSAGTSGSPLTI